jgi:hypothetical protein
MILIKKFGHISICVGLAWGVFFIPGCGGTHIKVESQSQSAPATGKENLKKRLQAVAETGSGGSGLVGLRESLLELKKTEPALADQLLLELTKLERTSNADIIKKVASEMVAKL